MGRNMSEPVDETRFLDDEAQSFIAATGQSLAEAKDAQTALTRVMSQVTEFLGAEAASIFLVDEPTGELVLRYAIGAVGDKVTGLRLDSGQGVVGWVVKHNEDLIVPYPGLDARFFEGVDKRTGFATRSILCGPIRSNGRAIGAIEVLNKKLGTFNDDDLIVLRAIARMVARVVSTTGL
jgi:sigma-B regulation protein RsbU (phosphoserine phosphatase)